MKKIITSGNEKNLISEIVPQHPYENMSWETLNDRQKARVLLGSTRLIDEDIFIKEFKSWEQPDRVKN